NLRSARLTQEAGDRNVKRAEQTVAFTVASNFLAIVQQQEQVRVQQENLAAQEAQEKQIKAFVDAGSRPISDLYQQQATVAAARGSRWPALSLTAGYNSAYNSATDVSFNEQLNQRRGGSLGIGVSLPLFDRGTTDLATQRAQINEENARLELKNTQQQIGLEV